VWANDCTLNWAEGKFHNYPAVITMSGLSRRSDARLQRFSHSCEQVGLFGLAGDLHALELGIEPDINVQIVGILVEMKQCTVGTREATALALSQLRQLAQLHQQRL